MKTKRGWLLGVLLTLLVCPGRAGAQAWSGVIPPGRAIDWSGAGVPGGIPNRTTNCATINASTYGSGANDATSGIQTALNGCASGDVVLLGAGTFKIATTINVPSNVTLRGAGADQTVLNCTGSSHSCITMGSGTPSYTGALNITSGNTGGSTSLTLSATTGVTVGGYLVVSELNDSSKFVSNIGGEGACTWCDGWSTDGTRSRGQIVKITAINGSTVTVTPALYDGYASANTPTVIPFSMSESNAGVEALQIYQNNTGYTDSVQMSTCAYCWVSGIETNYADGDLVEIDFGYHDEIRDSYFSNSFRHGGPGTTDGTIEVWWKTSETKIENNIFDRCHACIFLSRGPAGNVVAYNYITGSFDSSVSNFMIGGIAAHGATPQYNLIEGNVFPMYYPDQVWGGSYSNTSYRNWVIGTSLACAPVNNTRGTVTCGGANQHYLYQAARAEQIAHASVYVNLVGEIVGSSQAQAVVNNSNNPLAQAASVAYNADRSYDAVWYGLSWGYGESNDSGGGNGCSTGTGPFGTGCNSTDAFKTSFIHGLYNNQNSSTTWAGGVTQTLPASFYLSSRPAWWPAAQSWPAIGPDITGGGGPGGHIASVTAANAAMNCYFNVMGGADGGPGSPLTFNAAKCYAAGSSSGSAPNPPTGLKAVVQ